MYISNNRWYHIMADKNETRDPAFYWNSTFDAGSVFGNTSIDNFTTVPVNVTNQTFTTTGASVQQTSSSSCAIQNRMLLLENDAMLYVACVISVFAIVGNIVVFSWRVVRHNRSYAHTTIVANVSTANMLGGLGLGMRCLDHLLPRYVADYCVPLKSCHVQGFLKTFSYEANMAFLLITAVDRLLCVKHDMGFEGLRPVKVLLYSIFAWGASFLLAGVPLLPIYEFTVEDPYATNPICSTLHSVMFLRAGWTYFLTVHFALHPVIFVVTFAIYGITVRMMVQEWRRLSDEHWRREKKFFGSVVVLTFSMFLLWLPSFLTVWHKQHAAPMSGTHNNWTVSVVELVALLSETFHTALFPVTYTLCNFRSRNSMTEEHPTGFRKRTDLTAVVEEDVLVTHHKRISFRLSNYLEGGNTLNTQDAVVMTSCLSNAVHTLHKIGMTAGSIDPNHILVEKDDSGSLVDTHLISVPSRPRQDSFDQHMQNDKDAIGEIFECVMEHIRERPGSEVSPSMSRSGPYGPSRHASVKLLKTLSVRSEWPRRSLKRTRTIHERRSCKY